MRSLFELTVASRPQGRREGEQEGHFAPGPQSIRGLIIGES